MLNPRIDRGFRHQESLFSELPAFSQSRDREQFGSAISPRKAEHQGQRRALLLDCIFRTLNYVSLTEVPQLKCGSGTSRMMSSRSRCQVPPSLPAIPKTDISNQPHFKSCERIKDLGYIAGRRVNLYGDSFEIVSDPFVDDNCVAVRVISKNDPSIRTIRLPVSILVGMTDLFPKHVG